MKDYYKKIREKYKSNPKEYWNLVARKYKDKSAVLIPGDINIKNAYYDAVQRKVLSKIFDTFTQGSKVLDLGCGVGRWSLELANRGMRVTAVDVSREMIKIAKEKAKQNRVKNINFKVQDVHEINFPQETFDDVIVITVLQHVLDNKKRAVAVKRIIKSVRVGGKILLLEKVVPEKYKEFHVKPVPEREWIRIFESGGARFVDSYPVPSSPLVEFVTSAGAKFKYRGNTEGSEYPGAKSVEELVSKPVRLAYQLATAAAVVASKPIDFLMQSKTFSRFAKHKLMIFEKV